MLGLRRHERGEREAALHQDAVQAGRASAAAAEVEAALEVPLDKDAAAFFDVDNTIMQGASIFHLARGLYARDFFSARDIGRFAWQQTKFRVLGRENLDNVHEARETALSFAEGHTVAELTTIGEEVFDEVMAAKVWPGHPRARPDAPRSRPARLAGHGDPGRGRRRDRPTAGPDRRAGHRRGDRGRRLHRAAWSARSCTARPRPRRCGPWPSGRAST